MIDATWDDTIAPILAARFGAADAATIAKARAYAYGGSVMPDMGYYPFGSRFFTNLLHYTRSGDFVEALIQDARDINEYAFARRSSPAWTWRSAPFATPSARRSRR